MRQPLGQFAARIAQNQEVEEFIRGLIEEHGVPADRIIRFAQDAKAYGRGEYFMQGGTRFRMPLPGADPHDPDGGHDDQGH